MVLGKSDPGETGTAAGAAGAEGATELAFGPQPEIRTASDSSSPAGTGVLKPISRDEDRAGEPDQNESALMIFGPLRLPRAR